MQHKRAVMVIATAALLGAIVACGGSFSTANIADAWLSSDVDGNNRTTTFAQDQVFYAQVDLNNAPDDTTLKASWYAVNAEGVDANFLIDSTEFTSGDGQIHFQLENDQLWPVGEYKVEIYLNDTLAKTLSFEVQ